MNYTRLTSVNDIVRNWTFISNGLLEVGHHLRFDLGIDTYRKILFKLAKQPNSAWLALATDGGLPVAFIVAHECTPLFATRREFDASIYYHEPGYASAIAFLQHQLNLFCVSNNIRRYYVTTCRKSGRPMHVFGVEWTGLQHAHRVFKKELN